MNQANNYRQKYVIYWYKSNEAGFIEKYSFSAKLWPKMVCMPIFGHTFFYPNSAIFGPIGLEILWELISIDW